MKLLYKEFSKLWNRPALMLGVLLLVAINSGLWFVSTSIQQSNTYNYHNYNALQSYYDTMPIQDAMDSINNMVVNLDLYQQYERYQSIPDTIPNKVEYFDDAFNDYEFIQIYQSYVDTYDLHDQVKLHAALQTYFQQIVDYQQYVNNVKDNFQQLKTLPVWSLYSKGKQQYYDDLDLLYSQLKDVTPVITNHLGFESVLSINATLLLSLFGMFLVLSIFGLDETTKMDDLLLMTEKGRSRTTFNKVLVLVLTLSGVALLVYGLEMVLTQLMQGEISWGVPVQSIPALYTVPFQATLGQWYLQIVLKRILALVTLSLLFGAFYHLFSNKRYSIYLFITLLGLSAFVFIMITDTALLVWLKYLNLFALLSTHVLFRQHRIIELFSFVISVPILFLAVNVVILAGSLFTIFTRRLTQKRFAFKFKLRFVKFKELFFEHLNLFRFESYKLFIMQKGWAILLIVASLLGSFFYQTISSYKMLESQRQLAKYYDDHGGVLTQAKIDWIENENERYLVMEQDLQEAAHRYQNEKLSEVTFNQIVDDYIASSAERSLFRDFYSHYLERRSDVLIYPTGYQTLFSMQTNARDFRSSIILLLGLIFILAPIVSQDKEEKMDQLYLITEKGGTPLKRKKLWLALSFSMIYILLFTLMEWLSFSFIYNLQAWQAQIADVLPQNLVIQAPWILNLHLWQYFILILVIRVASTCAIAMIIVGISNMHRTLLTTYVVAIAIFFVPILLKSLGNQIFDAFTVDYLLMGNAFVYHGLNIVNALVLFGAATALLIQYMRFE